MTTVVDGFRTNSAAWRWIDCQERADLARRTRGAASSTGVVPGFTAGRRGA